MLYELGHILRDKFPWLWNAIGSVNSCLFTLRYGKYEKAIEGILEQYSHKTTKNGKGLKFSKLDKHNTDSLVRMFSQQPTDAFMYFHPHGFDRASVLRLASDKSFLAYIVTCEDSVVGYIFQRSFFWGKSFRGYMTDYRWRRLGINKLMNECMTEISQLMGLHVYGTISPKNESSIKSAQAANNIRIINQLEDGDYFVEYLPKE